MTRLARGRVRCRYQAPHGHHCDRPAVGTAWNAYAGQWLPICLPCVDRIGIPLTPYARQPVSA